jgi:putative transposase
VTRGGENWGPLTARPAGRPGRRPPNTIERLHEEFRRRVKTQGSLPSEDAAVVLLFSLVASGQIRLWRIDGWQKITTVLGRQTPRAA